MSGDESAFPRETIVGFIPTSDGGYPIARPANIPGLTKRELFAAMAMQGLITSRGSMYSSASDIADAILLADALLLELAKEKS